MPDSWLPALVLIWLCAMPALGLPTPRRMPERERAREEVLAGTDFLSVFMRTSSTRNVPRPTHARSKGGGSDFSENSNSVQLLHRLEGEGRHDLYADINQKGDGVLEASDYAEDFESVRHFDSKDRFAEQRRFPASSTPPGDAYIPAQNTTEAPATTTTDIPTTTVSTPPSDSEEEAAVSTFYDLDEENPSEIGVGVDLSRTEPSFASYWARFTERVQPPTPSPAAQLPPAATPKQSSSSDQPLQVISVRVSSSVVRQSHKVDDHQTPKPFESEKLVKTASTLVTQEQPTLTAVQRSSLNVEEAPLIEGQSYGPYRPASPVDAQSQPSTPAQAPPQVHQPTTTTIAPTQSPLPQVPPLNIHNLASPFGIRSLQGSASQTSGFSNHQQYTETRHGSAQSSQVDYHNSPEALAAVQEEINVHRTDFLKIKESKPENRTLKVNRYELENKPRNDDEVDSFVAKDYSEITEQNGKEKQGGDVGMKSDNEPKALAFHYDPPNPQLLPVSYHTSVSSATSGSRVRFYSEPLGYRKAASQRQAVQPSSFEQQRERVYGVPEQNYEVDEAVSVVTNGRTHGIQRHGQGQNQFQSQGQSQFQGQGQNQFQGQVQSQFRGDGQSQFQGQDQGQSQIQGQDQGHGQNPPTVPQRQGQGGDDEDPNKSGYVLEGRNYRKYRVEEKTADGFIVGEYGVVSHDDGSLRGVRYTADSTINPRLIYDALVKFLSLK